MLLGLFCVARAGDSAPDRSSRKRRSPNERRVRIEDSYGNRFVFHSNDTLGMALNGVLGLVVGFMGIGGGVLQVPILLYALRYPPHIATATSHFVTAVTAGAALVPHVFLGNVHYGQALWMGVGVIVGAQVGAEWARRLRSTTIIYLFGGLLLVISVRLLFL